MQMSRTGSPRFGTLWPICCLIGLAFSSPLAHALTPADAAEDAPPPEPTVLAAAPAITSLADEITVFGSHIASDPERIPGAVTILGPDVIDHSHPTNLGELLRKAPGILVRDEEG